jgi:hypothetical protein
MQLLTLSHDYNVSKKTIPLVFGGKSKGRGSVVVAEARGEYNRKYIYITGNNTPLNHGGRAKLRLR